VPYRRVVAPALPCLWHWSRIDGVNRSCFVRPPGRPYNGRMSEPTRQQLLQELQTSQQQVVDALAATERIQDWQREPVEWSFRYLAAHLAAVERQCHLRRVKRIAAGGTPEIQGYIDIADDLGEHDMHESLRAWIAARQQLIKYVRELDDRQLRYVGIHEKIGAITVLDTLQEILDQDYGNFRHVCQLIIDFCEEDE
jgi:hypothetical protein